MHHENFQARLCKNLDIIEIKFSYLAISEITNYESHENFSPISQLGPFHFVEEQHTLDLKLNRQIDVCFNEFKELEQSNSLMSFHFIL